MNRPASVPGLDATGLARLDVRGVDPQVPPVALDLAVEECANALVQFAAQPADLALETPVMPNALTRSSTERVEIPSKPASRRKPAALKQRGSTSRVLTRACDAPGTSQAAQAALDSAFGRPANTPHRETRRMLLNPI
jgi:hypothetical protein